MKLRSAFLKASIVIGSLGMAAPAQAQTRAGNDHAKTITVQDTHDHDHGHASVKPTSYKIPNYATSANAIKKDGTYLKNFEFGQRYTYANIPQSKYAPAVSLRNIVSAPIWLDNTDKPAAKTVEAGGLYFAHGYDKFGEKDIVKNDQLQTVNLDKIAETLLSNPSFSLKMTGHADTSGDSDKNYSLSENRLETGKQMLLSALEKQGLTKADAEELYAQRIAPHTTIVAQGEQAGPIKTSDGVREQGNRVVTFAFVAQTVSTEELAAKINKTKDFDNHEHIVILNVPSSSQQKDIAFRPDEHANIDGQMSVADENTSFVIRVASNRDKPFIIQHYASDNNVADNTNFLIETDKPGSVKSTYNFESGMIDVSQNGKVIVQINTPSKKIDPAVIRVGQVDSKGNAVISPLTNLAEIAPISQARQNSAENNILTQTADRIVHLSIDAKHMYMENVNNPAGYQQALKSYGFEQKLNEAFKDLQKSGIETQAYEQFVLNSYTKPDAKYYSPDQVVFPFQTYEGLRQSQPTMAGVKATGQTAYAELTKIIKAKTETQQQKIKTAARTPNK